MSIEGLVGLTGAILTFTHERTFLSTIDGMASSGQADRINEDFDAAPSGPATGLYFGGVTIHLRNDE
jgi:hypothetical protein